MTLRKFACVALTAAAFAAFTLSSVARSEAQTESVLHSFNGADGANPSASLLFDSAGSLYGTAQAGGSLSDCGGLGCGVVFKLTRVGASSWGETVIHQFRGGRDGANPQSGLVQDAAGNLYGTTQNGGGPCTFSASLTCGVVFKLSPTTGGVWRETVLHVFTGGLDGGNPSGGVILDAAGNLFGVTHDGGSAPSCSSNGTTGCGVVYKLSPLAGGGWRESVLYSFFDAGDGAYPGGSLILDASGNLYGGSTPNMGSGGPGGIFELSPSPSLPWTFTLLHFFTDNPDGAAPNGSLVFDSAGNLYGTTWQGGIGVGVVFELSKVGSSWSESVIFTFNGTTQGSVPLAGVIFDSAGNLYGTASLGGANGNGLVYKLSPSSSTWTQTILHSFTGAPTDGQNPLSGLIFDAAGNLYGTTNRGGASNNGTIYEITP